MFTRSAIVRTLSVFLSAGLLSFIAVPKAHAIGWHQEIFVTVNKPVEIPGRVIGPGTYIFRVVRPDLTPYAVQVINESTDRSEGIFLTLPAHQAQLTGRTVIKLLEAKADNANAVPEITKWFYPGNRTGHEFIYSPAQQEFMSSLATNTHSAKG